MRVSDVLIFLLLVLKEKRFVRPFQRVPIKSTEKKNNNNNVTQLKNISTVSLEYTTLHYWPFGPSYYFKFKAIKV